MEIMKLQLKRQIKDSENYLKKLKQKKRITYTIRSTIHKEQY